MPVKKKSPIIIFVILAVLLITWASVGIYGFIGATEIDLRGACQIKSDAYFGNGIKYVFAPKADAEVTEESFNKAYDIIYNRIGGLRGIEITSDFNSKTITAIAPSVGDLTADYNVLPANVTSRYFFKAVIADYTGDATNGFAITEEKETIFDSTGIKDVIGGTTYDSSGNMLLTLSIILTDEAAAKLSEVTERVYNEAKEKAEQDAANSSTASGTSSDASSSGSSSTTSSGSEVKVPEQRYFLLLDGEIFQSYTFNKKVELTQLTLGSFNNEADCLNIANAIIIGALPFEMEKTSVEYVPAVYGDLLPMLGIALIILAALAVIFFVVYARMAGAVAGLIWLMQNSLVFIIFALFNGIYTVSSIITFAAVILLSFIAFTYMLSKLKEEYAKGKTVEGAAVYTFNAIKPLVYSLGFGSVILGILLLLFNVSVVNVGIILIGFGVMLVLCLIPVMKSSILSTQAYDFMRKGSLFKNEKEGN